MKDLRIRIVENENGTFFGRVDCFVKNNWKSDRLTENSYTDIEDAVHQTRLLKCHWMLEK